MDVESDYEERRRLILRLLLSDAARVPAFAVTWPSDQSAVRTVDLRKESATSTGNFQTSLAQIRGRVWGLTTSESSFDNLPDSGSSGEQTTIVAEGL